MVAFRRKTYPKAMRNRYMIVGVFLVVAAIISWQGTGVEYAYSLLQADAFKHVSVSDPDLDSMRAWKRRLESACREAIAGANGGVFSEQHIAQKEALEATALSSVYAPDTFTLSSSTSQPPYRYCKHVFVDLGTNRGDSIGYAVDASLDVCSPLLVQADPSLKSVYRSNATFPHPHLDVNELKLYGKGFTAFGLMGLLQRFSGGNMEEMCVYGMEGNPFFTESLKKLENFVNGMRPRPLRHLHIHTESVVAAEDGPTTLYVDQFSVKDHFWGSSLLQSMPDTRKTAKRNNGTFVTAAVNGIALSTLLRNTLSSFDPKASLLVDDDKRGGSLLVKMDVEGAEYAVLKEVANSGVLCDFVQMGNNATMIVEFHQQKIKDLVEREQAMNGIQIAKDKLKDCGVRFKRLPTYWTE